MTPGDARPGAEDGEADPARRTLIRGVAVAGLAGLTGFGLSGCGDDAVDPTAASAPEPATPASAEPAAPPSPAAPTSARTASSSPTPSPTGKAASPKATAGQDTSAPDAEPSSSPRATDRPAGKPAGKAKAASRAPKGAPIAGTSEIPVGSGKLYEVEGLIVTQPTAGEFRGFSCFCPHEGCVIDVFEGQSMVCTCHGSSFRITDGKRLSGPARKPVPSKPIVLADGNIYRTGRTR